MKKGRRVGEPAQDAPPSGGKLVRAGDRGHSLAERVSSRLDRLAWRSPLHALRLRGRTPLQLIAVPKDAIAGDKMAGEAILAGYLPCPGGQVSLRALDFNDPALPAEASDHLQSFAWLRDLAAATTRERGAVVAEAAARRWLHDCGRTIHPRGWRPDLWGRRILFWTAYAPYLLSSQDRDYRAAMLNTLARGARHLDRSAARAPDGIARVTAWAGVIAASLLVQGGHSRLARGQAGFARALEEAVHEDGGLVSRSPIEQLALVELLAQLRGAYIAARRPLPNSVAEALAAAASALSAMALGDGALSSWQGGNPLSRRRLAAAIEGAGADVKPLRAPRGWGYQRIAAKQSAIILDAAPPPPGRALLGGCASTLAFEFTDGPHRLVVNCGGPVPGGAALPAALVQGLRTTAAHSTLTLGDRNSTAVHGDGLLGKGVNEVELSRDDTGGRVVVEASHDGYVRSFGLLHQRQLTLSAEGLTLEGEDRLIAPGRPRRGGATPFALRFHLAPGIEVIGTADGNGALLRIPGGKGWQFRARGGHLAVEDSLWINGEARPQATRQLVVMGDTPPTGLTISWVLRRTA